ncbi:P-loop containing nucleoside triphosphate hydrolase protein [Obba rivulosa]|uniref:RNA helicase n=1 Tax=Obba rivulosa TaxID=1052685 RepID=A0A8E2DG71_9APHY|nr:P-loop containing nucleoside triphosphate hydrolase protein [Obba rivulosa]
MTRYLAAERYNKSSAGRGNGVANGRGDAPGYRGRGRDERRGERGCDDRGSRPANRGREESGFQRSDTTREGSGFRRTDTPPEGSGFRRADAPREGSGFRRTDEPREGSGFRRPDTTRDEAKAPLIEEFDLSSESVPMRSLPAQFTTPPLMPDLLTSVHDVLGPDATPTPIQALSLKHLFKDNSQTSGSLDTPEEKEHEYHQYLLASETGSGKSIAYMLPVLQDLKVAETSGGPDAAEEFARQRKPNNPRALVLAPTHELSRQLSAFAKALIHKIKLRVVCASRANQRQDVTASQMARGFTEAEGEENSAEVEVTRMANGPRAMDVLVGTPSKILEMVKGRGWDRSPEATGSAVQRRREGLALQPLFKAARPEIGLQDVEWVVIDEADVLFVDPDFQAYTRLLLAEVSAARGRPVPFEPQVDLTSQTPTETDYPFHLLLTTATIPSSLAAYLDTFHPSMTRLASPNLHHLPAGIKTQYAAWTGVNRNADVEQRLRRLWYADVAKRDGKRSKVLIFCNKSSKVVDLGEYLTEKGIPNVALVSGGEMRKRGSNTHLAGFLRGTEGDAAPVAETKDSKAAAQSPAEEEPDLDDALVVDALPADVAIPAQEEPHVLITTSLLSRGLDFSPDIKHVFIMDEPRNMVDFLHRAGRTGRAGGEGTVVVFGKSKGRGSERTREVRTKVRALAA